MNEEQGKIALAASIILPALKRWKAEQDTSHVEASTGDDANPNQVLLRKAFELLLDNTNDWFFETGQRGYNERFLAGCTAAGTLMSDKDRRILRKELDMLRALNAAVSGIPVDFEAVFSQHDDTEPEEMLRANATFIEVAKEKGIDLHA